MASIFGPPGVGEGPDIYDIDPKGVIFIEHKISGNELLFLIQQWNLVKGERVQEVKTLADTGHLYTFGKELPRIEVSGYFISTTGSPKTAENIRRRKIVSDEVLEIWDSVRAKAIGAEFSTLGAFSYLAADIHPLGRTFFGVGINLQLNNSISLETMVNGTFTIIVMEEEDIGSES